MGNFVNFYEKSILRRTLVVLQNSLGRGSNPNPKLSVLST